MLLPPTASLVREVDHGTKSNWLVSNERTEAFRTRMMFGTHVVMVLE
jgi:hypothetical protein